MRASLRCALFIQKLSSRPPNSKIDNYPARLLPKRYIFFIFRSYLQCNTCYQALRAQTAKICAEFLNFAFFLLFKAVTTESQVSKVIARADILEK